MAVENIINKNLDNITNVAKGLDKEMLDMTYSDKYYKDVINPAKLGQGPIPSKTQMMYQNLKSGGPFKAMRIGMDPYLPSFMGGGKYGAERAMPTGPARTALGAGSGILRTAASLPMQAVMAGPYGISQAMGPSVAAGDFINDEQFQLGQSEVGLGDFYSGNTNLLSDAEKAMMADQYDVGYSFADNERITPNIPSNVPSNFVDTGRDFSMFDQARMGDAVSGTNVQGMDLEMDLGAFMNPNIQPSQNMFERFGGAMQGGLESLRNKAGSIADFIPFIGDKSLTGMAMQGLGKVASGLGNMFERRDGMATVDEFGNLISGADLDKQNALGGYYTDAARASRRRGKSIAFMQRRKAEGKKYGERRLEKLLADQAKEDAARQKAFEAAMAQGQGFYDSLNQGRGASVSQSSREQAGAGYNSVEQGSPFADGGLASMFVRRG